MLGQVPQIAGIGFGIVFLILIILALVIWGVSIAIQRFEKRRQSK